MIFLLYQSLPFSFSLPVQQKPHPSHPHLYHHTITPSSIPSHPSHVPSSIPPHPLHLPSSIPPHPLHLPSSIPPHPSHVPSSIPPHPSHVPSSIPPHHHTYPHLYHHTHYTLIRISHPICLSILGNTLHPPTMPLQHPLCSYTYRSFTLAMVISEGPVGTSAASSMCSCSFVMASSRFWCCVLCLCEVTISSPSLLMRVLNL